MEIVTGLLSTAFKPILEDLENRFIMCRFENSLHPLTFKKYLFILIYKCHCINVFPSLVEMIKVNFSIGSMWNIFQFKSILHFDFSQVRFLSSTFLWTSFIISTRISTHCFFMNLCFCYILSHVETFLYVYTIPLKILRKLCPLPQIFVYFLR